ncbi:hypothetical protein KCP73_07445 [Salmonella enterica subsp. enterica]|nr:hypothetical protein KCP73_07445 [Salmonella enterica subsp. enterica]
MVQATGETGLRSKKVLALRPAHARMQVNMCCGPVVPDDAKSVRRPHMLCTHMSGGLTPMYRISTVEHLNALLAGGMETRMNRLRLIVPIMDGGTLRLSPA